MEQIDKQFAEYLSPLGYEFAPFLVKWYNELVTKDYQLQYDGDTLCYIVISSPKMWETFSAFCKENHEKLNLSRDPLDQCTSHVMGNVTGKLDVPCDVITDHDMQRGKRIPRILVQTAGHVAGIAYYYQKQKDDPVDLKYGVSSHHRYGGYFAFRAAFVFKDIKCPDLKRVAPIDAIGDRRVKLLRLFAKWDWEFRDVMFEGKEFTSDQKYNKQQDEFFRTLPENRKLPL